MSLIEKIVREILEAAAKRVYEKRRRTAPAKYGPVAITITPLQGGRDA